LVPIFAQICSIVIFIVLLFLIRLKKSDKIIMSLAYLVSLFLIIYFTANIPYNQNTKYVDISWSIGPAIFTLIVYFILKFKKSKSQI
jgi:steroid 5-alpha reductase family enzyme